MTTAYAPETVGIVDSIFLSFIIIWIYKDIINHELIYIYIYVKLLDIFHPILPFQFEHKNSPFGLFTLTWEYYNMK